VCACVCKREIEKEERVKEKDLEREREREREGERGKGKVIKREKTKEGGERERVGGGVKSKLFVLWRHSKIGWWLFSIKFSIYIFIEL
jgi:hypothetical protein